MPSTASTPNGKTPNGKRRKSFFARIVAKSPRRLYSASTHRPRLAHKGVAWWVDAAEDAAAISSDDRESPMSSDRASSFEPRDSSFSTPERPSLGDDDRASEGRPSWSRDSSRRSMGYTS